MPPRKGLRTNPCSYVAPGGRWPDGPFEAEEGEKLPPELFLLQNISKALRGVVEARSEAAVARKAAISRKTVRNILQGKTWIDVPTLYRISQRVHGDIWSKRHWPSVDQR